MATVVSGDMPGSVRTLLDRAGFKKKAADADRFIIKPNLIENAPPPVTTDVRCIEGIAVFLKAEYPSIPLCIAEGSGGCDTHRAFSELGYTDMAERIGAELIDLDREETENIKVPQAMEWPEIVIPRILRGAFIISAAVLKHHTITGVTLSCKNMIGILPESMYGGYWSYGKSLVHRDDVEKVIHDLHRAVPVGFAVIDASIGQTGSHLRGGIPCRPPVNRLIAGPNPADVDAEGCRFLSTDPSDIAHIRYCREIYPP
jgi:uncharacterized protein (DUF362 family)